MKPFLIIRTGGTFPDVASKLGDFENWVARAMGLEHGQWITVNVQGGEALPSPGEFAGCAVTGSHDMVTDEALPWIETTAAWLRDAVRDGLPVFGICFGHQLLARALGGEAGFHPSGPEIGTMDIRCSPEATDDPLFTDLPGTFPGHTTHYQCALRLPPGSTLLAASDHEPHQAFRTGKHAWGVQFHPEFGAEAMRTYITRQADAIEERGGQTTTLLSEVKETPESTSLMRRFVQYCLGELAQA
ncbi:glutamine amidotransferase [Pseudodesulfovibrio cashew]|uniref:Glutamine amidotransferase n=1 Tax=Pseudodesulfovibrio cashew TaxID=2678688 RepID=A0A6I6JCQ2_9BACT|nr:glutamine amidotransferase [Pseudodesulfovibrio cashew]QGY39861.1 glutamine amidotransferase [Pseudodesulfovibrio cashew]